MCEYKKIELKKDSGVAVIRLNSPGTMNALDKILLMNFRMPPIMQLRMKQ